MEDAHGQVIESAAQIYEDFFVPALFAEWSPRVAARAVLEVGSDVLDVACGTGVLARELARVTGPQHVSGLDCNDGMLAVAARTAPRIHWHKGVAEDLPFHDARFAAVASQFGLMFFADAARAIREMWRVLAPGGTLVVAVWGALEATPGYAAMVTLLRRLFGDDIANELRSPFSLGDTGKLRALFADAGLPSIHIDTVVGTARFPSIADWVHTDVRGWTLADKLTDEQFAQLQREAPRALQDFVTDERVVFDSPAHLVTAAKP